MSSASVCVKKGKDYRRVKREVACDLVNKQGWAYCPRSEWRTKGRAEPPKKKEEVTEEVAEEKPKKKLKAKERRAQEKKKKKPESKPAVEEK